MEINWKVFDKYRQVMHLSLMDLMEWNDLEEIWEEARDELHADDIAEYLLG